jgi:hypothetical protein
MAIQSSEVLFYYHHCLLRFRDEFGDERYGITKNDSETSDPRISFSKNYLVPAETPLGLYCNWDTGDSGRSA